MYNKLRTSLKNYLTPRLPYFYTKCGVLGFLGGAGLTTLLVNFEIDSSEDKISFFRWNTKLSLENRLLFNNSVSIDSVYNFLIFLEKYGGFFKINLGKS